MTLSSSDDANNLLQRFNDHEVVDNQLKRSASELLDFLRDGKEVVTNIRVADDRREIRRREEAEMRDDLVNLLQADAQLAMEKLNKICRHWAELEQVKDPVNMNMGLEQQKSRIGDLMKQKDDLIEELRKELRTADGNYYRSQAKQTEDLECLCERINNHVDKMKEVCRRHLEKLQNTISKEQARRSRITDLAWQRVFEKKRELEESKGEAKKIESEYMDKALDNLILENEELMRSTKSRLESDNDRLQIELQKTKADVLLNTQKLDYNFEVLKQREEENVKNQQKKRLTRLNDTIVQLKKSMTENDIRSEQETKMARTEIQRLKDQIAELQRSGRAISQSQDLKVS